MTGPDTYIGIWVLPKLFQILLQGLTIIVQIDSHAYFLLLELCVRSKGNLKVKVWRKGAKPPAAELLQQAV